MGKKVFANGMEIAHKAGDGKVIAAFPDVCLSPPAPPAGPVPVPYPNTSKASDLQNGSSNVLIGGKPAALYGQSFYKTSPLGDEAATRSFGGSVITHGITGKTYFQAHSMNVKFEGKFVCRHLDITTSNHSSYPGSTPPMPNVEEMTQLARERIQKKQCPCCGKAECPAAFSDKEEAQSLEDYYGFKEKGPDGNLTTEAADRAKVYRTLLGIKNKNCTCNGNVFPKAPCDVFRAPNSDRKKAIDKKWNAEAIEYRETVSKSSPDAFKLTPKVNHLTPKDAGGCPDNPGNLQPHGLLCRSCQMIDDQFGRWQGDSKTWRDQWQKAFRASGIKRWRVAGFIPNWW